MISVTVRYLFTHQICSLVIFFLLFLSLNPLLIIKGLSFWRFDNLEVTTVTIRLSFLDDRESTGRYLSMMCSFAFHVCRYSLFTTNDWLPDLHQISICHLIYCSYWHPESRISWNRRKILQPSSRTKDSLSSTRREYHIVLTDFRFDYWLRCDPFFHINLLIWRLVEPPSSSSTNPCSADFMVFLSREDHPFGHLNSLALI